MGGPELGEARSCWEQAASGQRLQGRPGAFLAVCGIRGDASAPSSNPKAQTAPGTAGKGGAEPPAPPPAAAPHPAPDPAGRDWGRGCGLLPRILALFVPPVLRGQGWGRHPAGCLAGEPPPFGATPTKPTQIPPASSALRQSLPAPSWILGLGTGHPCAFGGGFLLGLSHPGPERTVLPSVASPWHGREGTRGEPPGADAFGKELWDSLPAPV